MMDTDIWSTFVNDTYAEYAIGGPTLELYCASYRVTHPDKYIECDNVTSNGYQVRWSDKTSYSNSVSGLTKDEFNKIYNDSNTSKASGYWLASPSANGSNSLMFAAYYGDINYHHYFDTYCGFRPLVCLESSVDIVSNGNGTYKLQVIS